MFSVFDLTARKDEANCYVVTYSRPELCIRALLRGRGKPKCGRGILTRSMQAINSNSSKVNSRRRKLVGVNSSDLEWPWRAKRVGSIFPAISVITLVSSWPKTTTFGQRTQVGKSQPCPTSLGGGAPAPPILWNPLPTPIRSGLEQLILVR